VLDLLKRDLVCKTSITLCDLPITFGEFELRWITASRDPKAIWTGIQPNE
jgi:hypothetical protein